MIRMPIGTLMRKILFHPNSSVRKPPIKGPAERPMYTDVV
jgi:hypothetical protein